RRLPPLRRPRRLPRRLRLPMSRPAVTGNHRGASTGNPRVVSTGNPRKAGTESPPLSAVREFLSFCNHPTLSAHDIGWYIRLCMLFRERSDFAARLKEELKNYDDFPNLLNALKAYHGKAEDRRARQDIEKTHRSPHQEKDSQKGGAREAEGGRQGAREEGNRKGAREEGNRQGA